MEVGDSALTAQRLAERVRSEAKKRGKVSVINVVAAQQPSAAPVISSFIQEEFEYVIGSLEIGGDGQLARVAGSVDGTVDVLLVDANPRSFLPSSLAEVAPALVHKSQLVTYGDAELWARTVMYELKALASGSGPGRIVIAGVRPEAKRLAAHLADQGVRLVFSGASRPELVSVAAAVATVGGGPLIEVEPDLRRAVEGAAAVAAFHEQEPIVSADVVAAMAPGSLILDATIGAVDGDAIQPALDKGIRVIRPDMRAAIAGELAAQLGTAATTRELMGRTEIAGWPVVAGGLVGARGDVVVDSISNPRRVVGVADGRGRILAGATGFEERIRMVEAALAGREALLHS